jgi:hypothetical protein
VAAEIVHDHEIAGSETRDQNVLDIVPEALAVDWPVKDTRCIDAVAAQSWPRKIMVFQ